VYTGIEICFNDSLVDSLFYVFHVFSKYSTRTTSGTRPENKKKNEIMKTLKNK